jgi:hypothetical protein
VYEVRVNEKKEEERVKRSIDFGKYSWFCVLETPIYAPNR